MQVTITQSGAKIWAKYCKTYYRDKLKSWWDSQLWLHCKCTEIKEFRKSVSILAKLLAREQWHFSVAPWSRARLLRNPVHVHQVRTRWDCWRWRRSHRCL